MQCPKLKLFDEHKFVNDDEKVSFYTGLPSFEVLKTICDHIAPFVACKSKHLTPFQEFILTLMTLRLNIAFQDLAYRFATPSSTVSQIFTEWMVAMDTRLSSLIPWPEREDL